MLTYIVVASSDAWNDIDNNKDNLAEVFAAAMNLSSLLDKLWSSTANGVFLTGAREYVWLTEVKLGGLQVNNDFI